MTRDAERAYVRQWVETGRLLEELRWRELAALTPARGLEATDALIDAALLTPLPQSRRESSGLVEQQALLHRGRLGRTMTSVKQTSGYAALRDGAGLIERSDTGRIALTGTDRRSYLQGLLTNDIEALTPGTGCYAAMLTAQGRMITDMRVLELGEAVQLDVPRALTQAVYDHLDRFVFNEDVKVADVTTAYAEIGLYGPAALDILVRAGTEGGVPGAMYGITRIRIAGVDARLVRSDDFGVPGFGVIVASADAAAVMAALADAGGVAVEESDLETVRIESGRPRFGADLDTDVIPLEAGLEARAISRSKGCYVGQEVIVRVQDRGHGRVARRLVGLTLDAAAAIPERGAPIDAAGRAIGRVTSAAWSPSLARPIALGYVHRDFVEAGTPVLVAGSAASVADLPLVPLRQRD